MVSKSEAWLVVKRNLRREKATHRGGDIKVSRLTLFAVTKKQKNKLGEWLAEQVGHKI